MFGWHHGLNGHEFEQIVRASVGQGSVACFSPQDGKESDMTEQQLTTTVYSILPKYMLTQNIRTCSSLEIGSLQK